MNTTKMMGNIELNCFDDIFKPTTKFVSTSDESISMIPLKDLYPPEFHPFQVNDDSAMDRLVQSIKKYGVREPGLARPRFDLEGRAFDGYELLCGNRRKRACEIAEVDVMPVIIRELDDDTATIAMVDSNLQQRERLLFSEKAWAYRIKLEALNHRGKKSDKVGQLSVDVLCEQTGESKNQVYRLIRLTELVFALLDKVDTRKIAFNPAVELSYLSQSEQMTVADIIDKYEVKPSLSQAVTLKRIKQEETLTAKMIEKVLSEDKNSRNDKTTDTLRFRKYFPPGYSPEQMEAVIVKLLTEWREGNAV